MLAVVLAASLSASQEIEPTLDRLYSLPRIIGTAPVSPAWSPDGKKLAFLWNDAGYDFRDVFVIDAGAPAPSRLTNLSLGSPPEEGNPGVVEVVWHPDGRRVLFRLGSELFLVSAGGGTPERVAEGARARFSPDGRHLARLRRGELLLRDLDSTERALVGDVESFEWSPDGARIAFIEENESRVPLRGIPDYLSKPEVELVPARRPYPGEEPASVRLGVVGVGQGASPRFLDLGGASIDPIFSYRWSRDGNLLVDTSDLYVKKRRILVVEPAAGTVREVYREEEPENVTAYWQAESLPGLGLSRRPFDAPREERGLREPPRRRSRVGSGRFARDAFRVPEARRVLRPALEGSTQ